AWSIALLCIGAIPAVSLFGYLWKHEGRFGPIHLFEAILVAASACLLAWVLAFLTFVLLPGDLANGSPNVVLFFSRPVSALQLLFALPLLCALLIRALLIDDLRKHPKAEALRRNRRAVAVLVGLFCIVNIGIIAFRIFPHV